MTEQDYMNITRLTYLRAARQMLNEAQRVEFESRIPVVQGMLASIVAELDAAVQEIEFEESPW